MTDTPDPNRLESCLRAPREILGAESLLAQARRRYRRRQTVTGMLAAVVCSVAVLVVLGLATSRPLKVVTIAPRSTASTTRATRVSPSSTAAPTTIAGGHRLHVIATIPVGSNPLGILNTKQAIWVANLDANTVSRIDPTSHAVTTIPVQGGPRALAAADGAIWVVCQDTNSVAEIDPARDVVTKYVKVGQTPGEIGSTGHALWVTNRFAGTVSRIDASSGTVTKTIGVMEYSLSISASGNAVWVAGEAGDEVERIDPATGSVVAHIPIAGAISNLFAVGHRLYVSKNGGTIDVVDTTRNRVVAHSGTIVSSGTVQALDGMTFASGTLFVAAPRVGVVAVDPASLRAEYHVRVGTNSHFVTARGRLVLVLNETEGTVSILG